MSATLAVAAACLLVMTLLNVGWLIHLATQHAKVSPRAPFAVALIYTPFLLAVFLTRRSRIARFLVWAWALVSVFRLGTLVLHAAQGRVETLPWVYWDVGLTIVAAAILGTASARTDVLRFHSVRPSRIGMLLAGVRQRKNDLG